ncbi:MAG: hypothetical protein ACI9FU_001778 [Granulosicoccus sp.]|jgi:hypothetical protein
MKSLFSFAIALVFSMSAYGQSFQAPQVALDHFNTTLSGTPVHWTSSNNQILGQFKNDGMPAGMRYEMDATFVRKETKIQTSDLPQALQNHLETSGVESSVISVFQFENDGVTYLINIGGQDHLFDTSATLISISNSDPFTW